MIAQPLVSAIYTGTVRHRRRDPATHEFTFPLFMMYLDLEELPRLFEGRVLWSVDAPNVAAWRREDYLGGPTSPLDVAVRERVREETGESPRGPIRMLTHLRLFGYVFNPVTFYYCFDEAGERVEAVVAEITNTPWGERHAYVLTRERATGTGGALRWRFPKSFHVSPFMPMDIDYDWTIDEPGALLLVHMNLARPARRGRGVKVFDATLRMSRREISSAALARVLVTYPLMTARVIGRIHLEALRLWLKGVPVQAHPGIHGSAEAREAHA